MVLPADWYELQVEDGVDTTLPGLYEWQIDGVGSYIGKYKRIRRPLQEYRRNVQRLLDGRQYRRGNPDGFRRIHRELARAVQEGVHIRLIILENATALDINKRENTLIAARGNLNDT